jgi:signal transduction histidine kinase
VRNPINNISLASELALESVSRVDGPHQPVLADLVDNIAKSADSAIHVLNDALNLQKLQAGTFEFVLKPFYVVEMCMQVVRIMKPQMEHKGIGVSFHKRRVFIFAAFCHLEAEEEKQN